MLDELKYSKESDEKAPFVNSQCTANYYDIFNKILVKTIKTFHRKKTKKKIVKAIWNMRKCVIW